MFPLRSQWKRRLRASALPGSRRGCRFSRCGVGPRGFWGSVLHAVVALALPWRSAFRWLSVDVSQKRSTWRSWSRCAALHYVARWVSTGALGILQQAKYL